jgi:hypothetical protein
MLHFFSPSHSRDPLALGSLGVVSSHSTPHHGHLLQFHPPPCFIFECINTYFPSQSLSGFHATTFLQLMLPPAISVGMAKPLIYQHYRDEDRLPFSLMSRQTPRFFQFHFIPMDLVEMGWCSSSYLVDSSLHLMCDHSIFMPSSSRLMVCNIWYLVAYQMCDIMPLTIP